jgi:hypothetical protein
VFFTGPSGVICLLGSYELITLIVFSIDYPTALNIGKAHGPMALMGR